MKLSLKFSTKSLVRLIEAVVVMVILVTFTWVALFLRKQFYEPLTQAYEVAQLKAKISVVNLEKDKLKEVLEALTESAKPRPLDAGTTRNVFEFAADKSTPPPTPVLLPADQQPPPVSPPAPEPTTAPEQ